MLYTGIKLFVLDANLPYIAAALFAFAAFLYASVGHGGASGYLAVMALLGFAPLVFRSTSLSLNIAVASIAFIVFARQTPHIGAWLWRILLPFVVTAMPAAYFAAQWQLDTKIHKVLVGFVLLYSAWRLLAGLTEKQAALVEKQATLVQASPRQNTPAQWAGRAAIGLALGVLSGLTGVGGGIFLSPLLIFMGLCTVRQSAPIAAAFIVLNSISGLAGAWQAGAIFSPHLTMWLLAAVSGGIFGARWGAKRVNARVLRWMLAAVLVVAGLKLLSYLTVKHYI